MTKESLITLFEFILGEFKKLETELRANQMTLASFKMVQPQHTPLLDAALVGARKSPALLDLMNSKYSPILETFHELADQAQTEEEVLKLFLELPKSNWIN